MSDLSTKFAKSGSKICAFAPIYPLNPPNYDDCAPGCYGTYENGIWVKEGNISDFGISFQPPEPEVYNGQGSFSSEKLKTTNMKMNGGVWVIDEDGEAGGTLGVKFSSSEDEMFSVATSGLSVQEMDTSVLDKITSQVHDHKDYKKLRFVVRLISAESYMAFGGQSKDTSVILTGSGEALQDAVAGKVDASLAYAEHENTEFNQILSAAGQSVPVGMVLYEISRDHGCKANNDPQ